MLLDEREAVASQVFFPDDVSREVFARFAPYRERRKVADARSRRPLVNERPLLLGYDEQRAPLSNEARPFGGRKAASPL